jgi:hypothetical protein
MVRGRKSRRGAAIGTVVARSLATYLLSLCAVLVGILYGCHDVFYDQGANRP